MSAKMLLKTANYPESISACLTVPSYQSMLHLALLCIYRGLLLGVLLSICHKSPGEVSAAISLVLQGREATEDAGALHDLPLGPES